MNLFLVGVFSIFGCGSDKGITAFNNDPEAEITSHVDGDRLIVGEEVQFVADINDDNHGPENLRATWLNAEGEMCAETIPNSDGVVTCDVIISLADAEVTVEVKDILNAKGTATVSLDIISFEDTENDAPTAEIVSPTLDGIYYSDQKVLLVAQVLDEEDHPEDLAVSWESDIDGLLDMSVLPNSSGETNNAQYLSQGEHLLLLRVEDSGGLQATDSILFTVGVSNRAPTCAITNPESGAETTVGELVIFQGETEDLDVPADWLEVSWSSTIDGVLGSSNPNSSGGITFPYSALSVGTHVISMQVLDEVGASCVQDVVHIVREADAPEPTAEPTSEPEPTAEPDDPDTETNGPPTLVETATINSGLFYMGSPNSEVGRIADEDYHEVELTNAFYLMTHEVTQQQFQTYMSYNPSYHPGCGGSCAVENVNWHEAAAFANAISDAEGRTQCYSCSGSGMNVNCTEPSNVYDCTGFRLPTEAEWEYAARANTSAAFWTPNGGASLLSGTAFSCDSSMTLSDGTSLASLAWFCGNNGNNGTKMVKQKTANGFGLYDMHGNVSERCNDWYTASLVDETDPLGASAGSSKVYRGGDWFGLPKYLRSAYRGSSSQTSKSAYVGFRLALTVH